MAINVSRLTLYAVLSAIENDLRTIVLTYLDHKEAKGILGADALERSLERAKKDGTISQDLSSLIFYLDMGDLCPVVNANKTELPSQVAAYVKKITGKINDLIPIRNRVAHIRPLNPSDFPDVFDTAAEFVDSENSVWSHLTSTMEQLKQNPSFVLGISIETYGEKPNSIPNNLPLPDFDETGFIGRSQLVDDVEKMLKGPHPIVSLIGPGGIGKTALAAHVAYKMIEEVGTYDCVAWVSSKSSTLTGAQFKRINSSIKDSAGIFYGAAAAIAGDELESVDAREWTLELMREFKVLLILDNLETVLDANIKSFLRDIPHGSKILITSRVGVGAFDSPVEVPPFSTDDSIQLIRLLSRIRNVPKLTKYNNKKLTAFCDRMANNPLYIKWFVAGVQAGNSPEQLFSKPDELLDFCMSNVYEYLDSDAQKALAAMVTVPGNQSLAEIANLCDFDAFKAQDAVRQLAITSFVAVTSSAESGTYESKFGVTEFARKYLSRFHRISEDDQKDFLKKRRQLVASAQQSEFSHSPYSMFAVEQNSNGDSAAAILLRKALFRVQNKDLEEGIRLAEQALALRPNYHEAHRVMGWINYSAGNVVSAQENYDEALSMSADSPQLNYYYAQFVLRAYDDVELARKHLEKAKDLDPTSTDVQLELARCLLFSADFLTARDTAREIAEKTINRQWIRQKAYDLLVQSYTREMESLLAAYDVDKSVDLIQDLKHEFPDIPNSFKDKKLCAKLKNVLNSVMTCVIRTSGKKREEAISVGRWVLGEMKQHDVASFRRGKVLGVDQDELTIDSYGVEVNARKNDFLDVREFEAINVGIFVEFLSKELANGQVIARYIKVHEGGRQY